MSHNRTVRLDVWALVFLTFSIAGCAGCLFNVAERDQARHDVVQNQLLLEALDHGEIEDARLLVLAALSSDVLTMVAQLEDVESDPEKYQESLGLLNRVRRHKDRYPYVELNSEVRALVEGAFSRLDKELLEQPDG